MNDPTEVARHLDGTTVPPSTVASLLAELPAWWLNRERPEIVASPHPDDGCAVLVRRTVRFGTRSDG